MPKLLKRDVDFSEFLKVVRREGQPRYLPFYEHVASSGFIARRTETGFDRMTPDDPGFWEIYVDFWLGMGYDCIPMEVMPNFVFPERTAVEGSESHGSEARVVISNQAEFENYPWPEPENYIDYLHFDTVSKLLPEGVKIVGGVGAGPYEWVSWMLGTLGMAYMLVDCPDVVAAVFSKVGELHVAANRVLAGMDCIGALRQGDDLGFKTSTFLSPEQLREYVFPTYRAMTEVAHAQNKPFILHSCGNLAEVYDDLIDFCRIDAKHSFEDVILPVDQFKQHYGSRITPLGGLDVDRICRSSQDDLRKYARKMIEKCFADGHWALGTGNSLTNYMPVENYLTVLEEGMRIAG